MMTRPCAARHCGELGPRVRWLERGGGGRLFSRGLELARSLRSPRRPAGRRNGGDGSSGCSFGHRPVPSPANRFLFPLPLTVCCVFDVLKQERIGAVPLAALGAPTLDPALAALGLPGANLNSQSLAADQLLKLMSTVDPKLNHVAAGLVSPSLKSDTSSKEIEEAMKRVREAQSLISAAIEPGGQEADQEGDHILSQGVDDDPKVQEGEDLIPERGVEGQGAHQKTALNSPEYIAAGKKDKKKEDKEKKRSKTPPKSYSTARRSRSASRERRRRRSRSGTRSPKKPRSPKRKLSRSPSPRRHKKEKKKDKDKERSRDERERSTSKKKKSKDKEKERERKSESDKDVKQVTRDYDEEEQGYDSEKEKKEEKKPTEPASPKAKECSVEKGTGDSLRESKVNGDDHHEEDMDMSD
ncbi:hypothetical protein E2I00_007940 [Balaenoptera physalus]|uniref:Serine/arginine-rich splicing factor 11 n=1 Tax=Balaenoptera physalus TaxID=9770 RepID=A0A643C913_BALPH|nr:hypothetical protein E2I00_007940 [Balaenoptera physalus]